MKNIIFITLALCLLFQKNQIFTQSIECADTDFGNKGVLSLNSGAEHELAPHIDFQSNGKAIIAGNIGGSFSNLFIMRLNSNGTPDLSFGNQKGYIEIEDPNQRTLNDILILPNDDILASYSGSLGSIGNGHYIYKLTANGKIDSSFGQSGVFRIFKDNDAYNNYLWSGTHLAMLSEGKFIAAGTSYGKIFIARFNSNLTLDTTFGTNGVKLYEPTWLLNFHLATLVCDPKGYIWIGGHDYNSGILLKFGPDGAIDNTFGTIGILEQHYSANFLKYDFKILSDGSVVVMNAVNRFGDTQLFINKYKSNGVPDTNFGKNAMIQEEYLNTSGDFNELMILPNGNILCGGRLENNMAIFQYTATGQKKMDFGVNGLFTMNYGTLGYNEILRLVSPLSSSNIYALGYTVSSFSATELKLVESDVDITFTKFKSDVSLDTGYGFGGKQLVFLDSDEKAFGFVKQEDGKIIVATQNTNNGTILTRYLPIGTIDRTFANSGKIALESFRVYGEACIKIYNNKILLGGTSGAYTYAAVYQLHLNGLPDLSFGSNGRVEISKGKPDNSVNRFGQAEALEIQNGKILLAGSTNFYPGIPPQYGPTDFKVARLNTNGTLDSTFGSGGIVTISVGEKDDFARLIKVRNNGKIVLIGDSHTSITSYYVSFVQLDPNGNIDNTFGTNGRLITSYTGSSATPSSAFLHSDGKITVASNSNSVLALRITEKGQLDPSFNKKGFILSNEGLGPNTIIPHALCSFNGRMYYGGRTSQDQLMLISTSEVGALSNPCSGQNLAYYTDLFPKFDEEIFAMMQESNASILLIGNAFSSNSNKINNDPFLIRFFPIKPAQVFATIPSEIKVTPSSGSFDFVVGGECSNWKIENGNSWITQVTPISGNSGQLIKVNVYFQANPSIMPRTAKLTLSGCGESIEITIVQEGAILTANPLRFVVGPTAGYSLISITGLCGNWTLTETSSWLSLDKTSGNQPTDVKITYEANTGSTSRVTSLRLSGCNVSLNLSFTQDGNSLFVSKQTITMKGSADTTTFSVTGGCASWNVVDTSNWVSIFPDNGTLPDTLTVISLPNSSSSPRSTTIMITGCGISRTIKLTQEAKVTTTSLTNIYAKAEKMTIAPNPAREGAFIETSINLKTPLNLILINALGLEVRRSPILQKKTWINRQELPSGLYYVLLSNGIEILDFEKVIFID